MERQLPGKSGVLLQVTRKDAFDLAAPGQKYTFGNQEMIPANLGKVARLRMILEDRGMNESRRHRDYAVPSMKCNCPFENGHRRKE